MAAPFRSPSLFEKMLWLSRGTFFNHLAAVLLDVFLTVFRIFYLPSRRVVSLKVCIWVFGLRQEAYCKNDAGQVYRLPSYKCLLDISFY